MDVQSKEKEFRDEKIEYDIHSVDEQVIVDQDPTTRHLHPEEHQFTFRAAIIGSLFGCLVCKTHSSLCLPTN
jgi:hypothetical protein